MSKTQRCIQALKIFEKVKNNLHMMEGSSDQTYLRGSVVVYIWCYFFLCLVISCCLVNKNRAEVSFL